MSSSDINTSVLDAAGPVVKSTVKSGFLDPTRGAIADLEALLAMTGEQWTAEEVGTTATALVAFASQTKPMSLAEILRIAGSVHPFITAQALGLAGDGVTDDGPALQRGAELWSGRGGAIFMLKALPGQSFYFKGSPRGASNISIICFSPHTVTATSRLKLEGAPATDPAATGLTLISDAAVGDISLQVSTASAGGGLLSSKLQIDDLVGIAGLRDSCGTVLQEQSVRLTDIDDDTETITFADTPLDYAFESTYAAGDYEAVQGTANRTLVSRLVTVLMDSDVDAGENYVPIDISNLGVLTEGDVVIVYDEARCSDLGGSNNSLINIEMARIVPSVSGDTIASYRLSSYLERNYTTAKKARLIKINPIVNASFSGATVEFTEAPVDSHSHVYEGRFAVDCRFENCTVPNTDDFGTKSNAARFDYSLGCTIDGCVARDARYVDDGEGNAFVLARSTDCQINNCLADGMRHSIQMLTSTNCSFSGNRIENPRHTPIDFHGARDLGCIGYDNHLSGSTTYEASATKSPPAVAFGNPALLAGAHRCGLVGGRIQGFKDASGSSHEGVVQFFPPSTNCFLRGVEFVDIGRWLTFEDVAENGGLISTGHRIENCSVDACADYLIDGDSRTNGALVDTFTDVQITGGSFRNIGKMIRATHAGELQISNCRFDEITPNNSFPYVAVLDTCANFYFAQNTMVGAKSGLHMSGCTGMRVLRNEFADQTAGTVFYDNGSNTGVWADNIYPGYTPSANRTGASALSEFPRAAGKVTMADDTAFSVIPPRTHGTVQVWSYNASTLFAMVNFIAVGTPDADIISGSTTANVQVTTGALAGTTGTDAKFTVSAHASNGRVYFENRLGSSIDIDFSFS